MGLFSKKECSICGTQSGVLSNRKLADGNLCKECCSRLSPFYNLSKRDTVAGVAAQLDYRERNRAELSRFRPAVAVGGAGKVFIDPQMGKFAVCREKELREENPDLFDLAGLRSCSFYARERYEKGDENEPSSYYYDFYLKFSVDHPFIRSFTYGYSGVTLSTGHRIKEEEVRQVYAGQREIKTGISAFFSGVNRKAMETYLQQYALAQDMISALTQASNALRGGQTWQPPAARASQSPVWQPPADPVGPQTGSPPPEYRQPAAPAWPQPVYQPPAASAANFCPNCGTRVSGGAFCPSCGTRL